MRSLLLKLFAASLFVPSLAASGLHAKGARAVAQEGRAQDCGLLIQSRKFDEYGDLPAEEEKSRLEKLAAALKAEPEDTKAFVIGYAGRNGRAGSGLARADRAKQTLNAQSSYNSYNTRVNTLDCGRRETPSTEFWITPAGGAPPRCMPTLDPPTPAPAKGGPARRPARRSGRRL
ncbi:MAG: hypothetical protein LC795_01850 [Acidobacteria bacterium]|nr:hypothetical protein [Acidobacteriota bacterium]